MDDQHADPYAPFPARLRPFLASWDYVTAVLTERLTGLTDDEYLWEPAPEVWTVRMTPDGPKPDREGWPPTAEAAPPRTLAWSVGHLGHGHALRADYLVGGHAMRAEDLTWPMTAAEGIAFMTSGLAAWRNGLEQMTDADLDTVGRSAFPHGLDPTLPLIEIVWWVNKELIFHAAEIWFVRDLYAGLHRDRS